MLGYGDMGNLIEMLGYGDMGNFKSKVMYLFTPSRRSSECPDILAIL